MKKQLLSILLFSTLLLVVGCKKEEPPVEPTPDENKTPVVMDKTAIRAVCRYEDPKYGGEYGSKLKGENIKKLEFNEEKYLIKEENNIVETCADDSLYQKRKKEYGKEETIVTGNLTTITKFDDSKRMITTTYISIIDYNTYTSVEKQKNYADRLLREVEEMGYKCSITGAERDELG